MVQIEAEKDAFTGPHEVASLRCEFERPRSPSGAPDAEDECIGAAFERMTADLLAEFAHLKEVMIDSFDSTERLLRRLFFATVVIVSVVLASAALALIRALA